LILKNNLTFAFAFLAIGLACTCNGFSLFPTASTSPPQETPTLAPRLPPTSLPTVPTPYVSQGLNSTGPWLLISTSNGLWAGDPDGSNLIDLTQGITSGTKWVIDPSTAVQPGGNKVVLLTSHDDGYFLLSHNQLAINLLSIPDGKIQKITDLTTPQTEPDPSTGPGDVKLDATIAIVEQQPSYAWSPDGSKLAFIGVLDGPTADVYLYNLATNQIARVSQDDTQDYSLSWSPDGNYLLFFGADSFGSGAGFTTKSVWVANGDGTNVKILFQPASNHEERLIGWRDNETAVLENWTQGSITLRLYNLRTRQETILGDITSDTCAAVAVTTITTLSDPGAVLFCKSDGLYLLPSGQTQPRRLSERSFGAIHWIYEGAMFEVESSNGHLATYLANRSLGDMAYYQDSPFEGMTPYKEPDGVNVGMYGAIWAWTAAGGDMAGAWITGPGLDVQQIYQGPANAPAWDLHNNLLFFAGSDLYRVTFDSHYTDAGPVGAVTGDVYGVVWVGPR
jgi:hypothetical protein